MKTLYKLFLYDKVAPTHDSSSLLSSIYLQPKKLSANSRRAKDPLEGVAGDRTCLLMWRLNVTKFLVLPKSIYQRNPIKFSSCSFLETNVLMLEPRWKFKGSSMTETTIKSEQDWNVHTFPNLKLPTKLFQSRENFTSIRKKHTEWDWIEHQEISFTSMGNWLLARKNLRHPIGGRVVF